jgi:hypothetical protein
MNAHDETSAPQSRDSHNSHIQYSKAIGFVPSLVETRNWKLENGKSKIEKRKWKIKTRNWKLVATFQFRFSSLVLSQPVAASHGVWHSRPGG